MRIRNLVSPSVRSDSWPLFGPREFNSRTEVKTASRQEAEVIKSISMWICLLLAASSPSRLTTLFRSQVRAPLASCGRSERKTNELKCENNHFNRTGFHQMATRRFIGRFSLYSVFPAVLFRYSSQHRSASVVFDVRYFHVSQTENNIKFAYMVMFEISRLLIQRLCKYVILRKNYKKIRKRVIYILIM